MDRVAEAVASQRCRDVVAEAICGNRAIVREVHGGHATLDEFALEAVSGL